MVYLIQVSGHEEKTMKDVTSYKLYLLNKRKINTFWESCSHFFLALQNLTKPMALERGHIGLPEAKISELDGLKF